MNGPQLTRVRRLLVLSLVLLQAVTVATILVLSHIGNEAVMLELAGRTLATVTAESAEHTEVFLESAHQAVSAASLMFSSGVLDPADRAQMENYLVNVLEQHTGFAGMYVGTISGDFLYVSRDPSADRPFRVKWIDSSPAAAGARTWWRSVSEPHPHGLEHDAADRYDPRTRPWFEKALAAGGFIWTDPYLFFTAQTLGITAAAPVVGTDGQVIGALGLDLSLDELETFLDKLEISESGSAFITGNDGVLIAAPFASELPSLASTSVYPRDLATIDTVTDIAGRQALHSIRTASQRHQGESGHSRFAIAGQDYVAHHMPLQLSDGQAWLVGTFAPENDFLEAMRLNERRNILLACTVLLISMMIGWYLATTAWTPVRNLHAQAIRDPLTQLYNRHFLDQNAARLFEDARTNGTSVAAVIIDIDHFKLINDTYGHAVGDEVIRAVADRLRSAARIGDVVARIGGEEYLLLLPTASADIAESIAGRIAQWFRDEPVETEAGPLAVTFSAGVAVPQGDAQSYERVLAAADRALYRAKRGGRDQVVVASQPVTAERRSQRSREQSAVV